MKRPPQPFWNKDWLYNEYVIKKKSTGEIAREINVRYQTIWPWLKKHGITARQTGVRGEKHPNFGKPGVNLGKKVPSLARFGKNNPNWKGGHGSYRDRLYANTKWRTIAQKVKKRDAACKMCCSSNRCEIHHILPLAKYPLLGLEMNNLILLCYDCHKKIRNKELRVSKMLFSKIIPERNHSL